MGIKIPAGPDSKNQSQASSLAKKDGNYSNMYSSFWIIIQDAFYSVILNNSGNALC